jgi:CDP-glucose 4,6-dehydratase
MRAYQQNTPVIIRNPYASRPWQFILECLSGYLSVASNLYQDTKFSGHWNIGPAEYKNYFVIDVVNRILKKIPDLKIQLENLNQTKECYSLRLDISKAINELDWKPKLSFEENIDFTTQSYLDEMSGVNFYDNRKKQIETYQKLNHE